MTTETDALYQRIWDRRQAVQDGILRLFLEAGHLDRLEDFPAWENVVPPRLARKPWEKVVQSDFHPPSRWGATEDGHRVKVGVKLTGQDSCGFATVTVRGPDWVPDDERPRSRHGGIPIGSGPEAPTTWLDELLTVLETVDGVTHCRRTPWWGQACLGEEAVKRWIEEDG